MLHTFGKLLVLNSFLLALFLHNPPATEAQVQDAYKVSFQNAKRLVPMMIEAAEAGKGKDFHDRTDEFKTNLDILQDKLERAGSGLHEKERKWLGSETTRDKVVDKCKKARIAAGQIEAALGQFKSPSSDISTFKSEWSELSDAMEKLWDDFHKRGKQIADYMKEMEERMKAFQAECRDCI